MAKRSGLGPAAITLIVIDALLVVALVVIMATWPDTTSRDVGTPNAAGETSAAAGSSGSNGPEETTQAEAVEVPADALDAAGFTMPSGNIWCELADEQTQCVIEAFDFSPPAEPACEDDVAGHVWVVTPDEAGPTCPADGVPQASDDLTELDYGDATTVGDFLCQSTRQGVTCRAISTGHGFEIARGGTRTF